MNDGDPQLERFLAAQAPVWTTVVAELTAGCKRTHWMWFVFPQLRGLGASQMARFYGIASADEARRYLAHRELGPRLKDCTQRVLAVRGRSLHDIFGFPDDVKFRSSMTLFAAVAQTHDSVFAEALARYNEGRMDERTLELLNGSSSNV